MIMDKLGKFFEDRRKKDIPVEVERRKKDSKKIVENKTKKTQN